MRSSGVCLARSARSSIGHLALFVVTAFLLVSAGLAVEPPAPPQTAEQGEQKAAPHPVEVLGRYRFKGLPSRALDIRWAAKDSIFVLTREHGVSEHRLEPGLPRVRRVLPGQVDDQRFVGMLRLAVSDSTVLEANTAGMIVWTARDPSRSEGRAQVGFRETGLMSDVDLTGDELLLFGVPALPYKGTEQDLLRYHLWTSRVEDERLAEFEPFFEDPGIQDKQEGARRDDFLGGTTGSLRYTADGDAFVYPGYRDEVWHLSAAGRLKKVWHLAEFGFESGRESADKAAREGLSKGPTTFKFSDWQAKSPLSVDDVLALGKSPCLVVRRPVNGAESWYLVVLDGDEVRSFSLPLARRWPMARLQADAEKKGGIVILEGDRSSRENSAPDDQEVLVVSLPPG